MTTESPKFKKLVAKLRELFELDKADLDFGIYRVLRARRDEIDRFLREELLPQVQKELGVVTEEKAKQFETKVEEEIGKVMTYGGKTREEAELAEPVKKARILLEQARNPAAIEDEVYSLLTTFFGRYYDGGDFISLRRYSGPGKERYMLPYNGEEVKLVWANMDQYYIKSAENFRDYAFRIPPLEADESVPEPDLRLCVQFKLVEASTEKDNIKADNGKRLFALADSGEHRPTVSVREGVETLEIPFTYSLYGKDTKQDALLEQACSAVINLPELPEEFKEGLQICAPTEKRSDRTILEKHLESYAAKNSFDYFIHKDLGGFLTRELDYFLKSDVLRVDDLLTENDGTRVLTLKKARAFKLVAEKIVIFLHRLEQFQKKLWLKKKFVVEARYCVTLDRVPEELYSDICACDAQWKEWEELIAVSAQPKQRTPEFLKQNSYLMVDTFHFNAEFRRKLLASMNDLDASLNGVCFHSENFQALKLMQEKYRDEVKCVYIDPPYNTEADRASGRFIYKDTFEHSSWLSLMQDRMHAMYRLLLKSGIFYTSLDEEEIHRLSLVLQGHLGEKCLATLPRRTKSGGGSAAHHFAVEHDYVAAWAIDKSTANPIFVPHDPEYLKRYKEQDEIGKFFWDTMERSSTATTPYLIEAPDGSMLSGNWFRSEDRFLKDKETGDVRIIKTSGGKWSVQFKQRLAEGKKLRSLLDDKDFRSKQIDIEELGLPYFPNPKPENLVSHLVRGVLGPVDTLLDFFAGSGTTGHAVINLNRENGGRRKYLLVEMGDHFESVLVARLKKIAYSPDWKDGKPASNNKGVSHCFKLLRLESYEDCLNNLILARTEAQQELVNQNPSVREDYLLGYFLDVETKGSVLQLDRFTNPWAYQLNIATGNVGESKPTTVDLVETFNWLLGMKVDHISIIEHLRPDKGFKEDDNGRLQLTGSRLRSANPEENADCRSFQTVEGTLRTGEKTLVIWRSLTAPTKSQDPSRTLEEDNVMLEEFLSRKAINPRERQLDLIYVNGDHTLDNLAERLSLEAKSSEEAVHFKVRTIEPEFQRLMFEGTED